MTIDKKLDNYKAQKKHHVTFLFTDKQT